MGALVHIRWHNCLLLWILQYIYNINWIVLKQTISEWRQSIYIFIGSYIAQTVFWKWSCYKTYITYYVQHMEHKFLENIVFYPTEIQFILFSNSHTRIFSQSDLLLFPILENNAHYKLTLNGIWHLRFFFFHSHKTREYKAVLRGHMHTNTGTQNSNQS